MGWSISLDRGDPLESESEGLIHPTVGARFEEGSWVTGVLEGMGQEARMKLADEAPVRVGSTAITGAGELPFETIVHAPVQSGPGTPTTLENLRVGVRTALVMVDEEGIGSATMPKFLPPSGADDLDPEEAAKTLIEDLAHYPATHLNRLRIVTPDERWIEWMRTHFPE